MLCSDKLLPHNKNNNSHSSRTNSSSSITSMDLFSSSCKNWKKSVKIIVYCSSWRKLIRLLFPTLSSTHIRVEARHKQTHFHSWQTLTANRETAPNLTYVGRYFAFGTTMFTNSLRKQVFLKKVLPLPRLHAAERPHQQRPGEERQPQQGARSDGGGN